ncbi:MAG: TIGR01777 family oxidoreductase [Streptomycetales bacterium]
MRVVIAGSSGLIGTALCRSLERDGHTVVRLVRRDPGSHGEVRWDRGASTAPRVADGADVVVNLAGAGLGHHRWTRRYKDTILRSRTDTAAAVAVMAAETVRPPGVLISASGIRYYGIDRGDEVLTESAGPASSGFLPAVAHAWEAATEPATRAGVRVCHLRLGLVLSRHGGVLPQLLPMFGAGLGARCGSGQEFWSYVSLTDTVRAIHFLARHPGAQGPYNITAPSPVRNREFTRALARELGKPAVLRIPMWALRMTLRRPPKYSAACASFPTV